MADEQALIPVEEKTIEFYGDELTAVRVEQGGASAIYVPIRRLCDNLGLTWSSQFMRIQRDEVLSEAVNSVLVVRTQSTPRARPEQEMLCLPIDLIPGWLFGIQTGRVKEDIRPKLIRYRRECFRVLWDAFKSEILPTVDPALAATQPAEDLSSAEKALKHAEALYHLARQQVAMEKQQETLGRWLVHHDQRLDLVEDTATAAHQRLDKAGELVGEHTRQLRRIELKIAGGAVVTDAQAAAISEAVKALAFELGKKEPDKGNPYQRVYSELYRKFRVPSYKALPLETFPDVMKWLTEWWQEMTEKEAPFAADVGGQIGLT